jgi:hypothetical protein
MFALIGRFSPVYIDGQLTFSGSHAAFGTTFRVTFGYKKAGTNSPKRANGRLFKARFHRSKQKLYFCIFFTKTKQKL